MLRKLLSLGAIVVVAVAFGASPAGAAHNPAGYKVPAPDGFSDGRL